MVLQELPEVLDDQLGCAGILVLLEPLVDPDDIHEFVGQVVLGSLPVLEDDRGAHRDRRDREDGEDRPLRPRDVGIDPHHPQVVVRDLLQARTDVGRGQLVLDLPPFLHEDLREGGGLLEVDLELLLVAVGADPLFLDILLGDDIAGNLAVFGPDDLFDLFGRHQQPRAGPAGHSEELSDQPGVADVDDGFCKLDVSEVARTIGSLLVAGLAPKTGVDDPEV